MNCDDKTLLDDARFMRCVPRGMRGAVEIYLLCLWAQKESGPRQVTWLPETELVHWSDNTGPHLTDLATFRATANLPMVSVIDLTGTAVHSIYNLDLVASGIVIGLSLRANFCTMVLIGLSGVTKMAILDLADITLSTIYAPDLVVVDVIDASTALIDHASFPSLTNCTDKIIFNNSTVQDVSFPNLTLVHNAFDCGNAVLLSILDLSSLASTEYLELSGTALSDLHLPSLVQVAPLAIGYMSVSNCIVLASVAADNLGTVGGAGLAIHGNFLMGSLSFVAGVIPSNNMQFQNNPLLSLWTGEGDFSFPIGGFFTINGASFSIPADMNAIINALAATNWAVFGGEIHLEGGGNAGFASWNALAQAQFNQMFIDTGGLAFSNP